MNKHNYSGKTVYVGIDVHKKTYCCVSICDGEVVKKDSMPAYPEVISNYLKNTYREANVQTVYEAGFSGFHLHRHLLAKGINNKVIHPASLEVAARERVKTDKRDALKMATQLSAHRLRSIHIPNQQKEEMRSVTRLRTNMMKLRHQVGQQLKALLFTQGLIRPEDDAKVSQKWIEKKITEIKAKGFTDDYCFSVENYADEWLQLSKRVKAIESKFAEQSEREQPLQLIYESVPGIGSIHGRQLANELGDMSQFRNERQLFSFLGLTPSEYSSGERVHQGNISRQGRSVLRKILVEAAWVAVEKDLSLKQIFNKIALRRGRKRAIIGIARRLAGRIRSCVLSGSLYQIKSTSEGCSLQEEETCMTTSGS